MKIQNENGFILPTLVILFLVTLALMATGGYVLMRSEGNITSEQMISMQMDYSVQGAVDYAVNRLEIGDFPAQTLDVGNVSVVMDTFDLSPANGYNPDFWIDLVLSIRTITRHVEVDIDAFDQNVAVWAKGSVTDIITADAFPSLSHNWDRLGENVNSLPVLNVTTLLALPNAQVIAGGTFGGTIPAGATGFLQPLTTLPWVIRYTGNVTLTSGSTFYGIMIVDGNLTIQSSVVIQGIIYIPTDGYNITMDSFSRVDGCIICGGDVTGSGLLEYVNHNAAFMATLETYRQSPGLADGNNIVSWQYL